MLERYFLKMKEHTLGEIVRKNDVFSFELYKPTYPPYYYPCEFYLLGERDFNYIVTHEDIDNFFDNRAMDKNRDGIYEYLMSLGLTEWNAWEICKRSKAINIEDYFWITQDKDEDYTKIFSNWRSAK